MIGTSLLFSGSIGGLLTPFDSVAPTAGYSLRNLSLSYSGAVVRVRRSGDNEEKDFNSTSITNGTLDDFLITLGTDDHSKEILSDFEDIPDFSLLCACNVGRANELDAVDEFNDADGFVSKWYDQFGSNDATNSTAAEQPKIWDASTGLVTEGGRPAIEFDGVDDYLQNTTLTSIQPTTYYLTAKANALDVLQRFFDGGVSNSTRHSIFQNAGFFQYFAGTVFTGTADNANQNLHYFLANGASSEEAINGATATIGNAGTNNLNGLTIAARWDGAANYGDVLIQELIIYDSDQSANRKKIEDNINDYYDIY